MQYTEKGGNLKYGDLLNGFMQYGDMGVIPIPTPSSNEGAGGGGYFIKQQKRRRTIARDDKDIMEILIMLTQSGILN